MYMYILLLLLGGGGGSLLVSATVNETEWNIIKMTDEKPTNVIYNINNETVEDPRPSSLGIPLPVVNRIGQATLLALILLAAVIFNGSVILNVSRDSLKAKMVHFLLIRHVCITDCLGALLVLPVPLVAVAKGHWDYGPEVCTIVSTTTAACWTMHLLAVALYRADRVLAVWLPTGHYPLFSIRIANIGLTIIWILAISGSYMATYLFGPVFQPALALCIPDVPLVFFVLVFACYCLGLVGLTTGYVLAFARRRRRKRNKRVINKSQLVPEQVPIQKSPDPSPDEDNIGYSQLLDSDSSNTINSLKHSVSLDTGRRVTTPRSVPTGSRSFDFGNQFVSRGDEKSHVNQFYDEDGDSSEEEVKGYRRGLQLSPDDLCCQDQKFNKEAGQKILGNSVPDVVEGSSCYGSTLPEVKSCYGSTLPEVIDKSSYGSSTLPEVCYGSSTLPEVNESCYGSSTLQEVNSPSYGSSTLPEVCYGSSTLPEVNESCYGSSTLPEVNSPSYGSATLPEVNSSPSYGSARQVKESYRKSSPEKVIIISRKSPVTSLSRVPKSPVYSQSKELTDSYNKLFPANKSPERSSISKSGKVTTGHYESPPAPYTRVTHDKLHHHHLNNNMTVEPPPSDLPTWLPLPVPPALDTNSMTSASRRPRPRRVKHFRPKPATSRPATRALCSYVVSVGHLLLYLPAMFVVGLQGSSLPPAVALFCGIVVYCDFLIQPVALLIVSHRLRMETLRTVKGLWCWWGSRGTGKK